MIDWSLRTGFEQLFRQPISEISPDLVLAGLRHPNTVVAASDSGAHISQILDSNIPTYFLSHWVRESGTFSWAEGIHMLTGGPCPRLGTRPPGRARAGVVRGCGGVRPFDGRVRPRPPSATTCLTAGRGWRSRPSASTPCSSTASWSASARSAPERPRVSSCARERLNGEARPEPRGESSCAGATMTTIPTIPRLLDRALAERPTATAVVRPQRDADLRGAGRGGRLRGGRALGTRRPAG